MPQDRYFSYKKSQIENFLKSEFKKKFRSSAKISIRKRQKFIAEIDKNLIAGGEVPVRKGSYTRINFSAAHQMADYWVKLLKENSEEIFENEYMRDDFNENLPLVEKLLAALAQFDDMTAHTRMENGESRSSIHFNMR